MVYKKFILMIELQNKYHNKRFFGQKGIIFGRKFADLCLRRKKVENIPFGFVLNLFQDW